MQAPAGALGRKVDLGLMVTRSPSATRSSTMAAIPYQTVATSPCPRMRSSLIGPKERGGIGEGVQVGG